MSIQIQVDKYKPTVFDDERNADDDDDENSENMRCEKEKMVKNM